MCTYIIEICMYGYIKYIPVDVRHPPTHIEIMSLKLSQSQQLISKGGASRETLVLHLPYNV